MAYSDTARTPEQIADLVASTQELIVSKGALTNLMTDLTQYIGLEQLYRKHQKVFGGGMDWRFDIITDHNHSARHAQLYGADTDNHVDATRKGVVGPRFTDANYVYDVREEVLNRGSAVQIYDFIKTKVAQMKMSAYELIEQDIWGAPSAADDKLTPYGLKFWITRQSDTDKAAEGHENGGFDGKDPKLATSASVETPIAVARAGISSSSVPRWTNWAARYEGITKGDLVMKMRYAALKTDFRSPISMSEPTVGSGRGIYTNSDVLMELESILEAQNMNLGNDIASKDGKCTFKSRAITHAPYLDDDTGDPIYFLDWSSLAIGMLAGWGEHMSKPIMVPNKHNVYRVFMDGGWNMVCTNLRKQAVISKTA